MALASPAVIVATIDKAGKLSRRIAPDVPTGEVRALMEAELKAALKAPAVLPARAEWLWQGPADPRGRPPFGAGTPVILFAEPVSGSRNAEVQQLRLIRADAMQRWTPEAEAMVRAILIEATRPGAAGLMVTRVSDGFHSEGTVAGQSESQFFLATEGGSPATLVVQRMPGQPPSITLATGEVIDRATPIVPQTLRWRALACGLPPVLPDQLTNVAGLADDYAAARLSLGDCGRRVTQ